MFRVINRIFIIIAIFVSCPLALGQTNPDPNRETSPLWNAAWITDTQTPDCAWISALVARVQANGPKMVLHTGDTRFEWANRCAWEDAVSLMRNSDPPLEFHLAPGNHDLEHGVLDTHLRRAATSGLYRWDTGFKEEGKGYYHNRVSEDVSGPLWPLWNPEIAGKSIWYATATQTPAQGQPSLPYRYVFKRGGIRFIVCDCYYTDEQRDWVRKIITEPDDSSVSILLQHKHEVDPLAKYFEGLEGKHNVKLVLSGDHHIYCYEERNGITYITSAGMAQGPHGDCDAMTLWVYPNRLQLDRYVLPKGSPMNPIAPAETIWSCTGTFSEYVRPAYPAQPQTSKGNQPIVRESRPPAQETLSSNLLYNGNFDNGVWYERFRGWSPAGWYQWFTRGGHAPEHAVGDRLPHSGKEYVRIHMWGEAWRGGILQNVRGLEPCHYYQLTGYGFFQPEGAPEPHARIGLDPCGLLSKQYNVDVTRHPAPPYDEGVGDDAKTEAFDGPDIPETTVWSDTYDGYTWKRLEAAAEARSATVTAILYCFPKQRPATQPIYEMNWDSIALREIPWPAKRLVDEDIALTSDNRIENIQANVHPDLNTALITWKTSIPCGAAQVLYRFMDSEAMNHMKENEAPAESAFPLESPVQYERGESFHHIEIQDFRPPDQALELQWIVLSRALVEGECKTLASALNRLRLPGK